MPAKALKAGSSISFVDFVLKVDQSQVKSLNAGMEETDNQKCCQIYLGAKKRAKKNT
jgi:hypothetical protein